MSIPRYYTFGAVARDARALDDLDSRMADLGVSGPGSVVALVRRGDERLAKNLFPEAEVRRVESGLSRRQWFEFASTFFSASTVSFLMGVVHLWTGLIVQAVLTVASVVGILLYNRRPRLRRQLLGYGLPDRFAEEWAEAFPRGFALVLLTVPEDLSEGAEECFSGVDGLVSPLAVDRRPVL